METMTVRLYSGIFQITRPKGSSACRSPDLENAGGPATALLSGATTDGSWGIQGSQWALDGQRRPTIRDWSGEKAWWDTFTGWKCSRVLQPV